MNKLVCPWWLGYALISPIRRLIQNPRKMLVPYIREGMTVLEPGPGMGFFTLELARLVGSSGRVVAVDIQPKMIAVLKRRAQKAGLADRLDARVAAGNSMNLGDLAGKVDFTFIYAVVHELPEYQNFFREIAAASKPGAGLYISEPPGHVKKDEFERELQVANAAGFSVVDRPSKSRTCTAILHKP
jgi:ubiquinone/menaquinone biosynthesis C-methylase UbiE